MYRIGEAFPWCASGVGHRLANTDALRRGTDADRDRDDASRGRCGTARTPAGRPTAPTNALGGAAESKGGRWASHLGHPSRKTPTAAHDSPDSTERYATKGHADTSAGRPISSILLRVRQMAIFVIGQRVESFDLSVGPRMVLKGYVTYPQ